MTFVTPVVEHWLEREIAQWVHPMTDRSDDPSHHERTLLPQSYILHKLERDMNMLISRNNKIVLIQFTMLNNDIALTLADIHKLHGL